jgi:hypothetical protein
MKYLLFALLLSAGPWPVLAQKASTAAITPPDQYCTLIARGTRYSALQFQIDYGQQSAKYTGITAEQAKADQANMQSFFSVADVLNYLSGRGWELVSVSTLAGDISYPDNTPSVRAGTIIGTFRSEVQYLLRRRGQ